MSPLRPSVRRSTHAAILAAAVVLVTTMTLRARSEPSASQAIRSGPATGAAYLGSSACQDCHEDQFATWKKSLHVQMTRPIADARVAGDFSPGTRLTQNGRSYRMESRGGKYFISVAHGDRPAETFEIHYTLGAQQVPGLPVPSYRTVVSTCCRSFWRTDTAEWIDYAVIGPVPDGPHDYRQIWNVNCVNCHATNLAPNYSLESATYTTTWTEMGIGCEACHGPGSDHVRLMRERRCERREAHRTCVPRIPITAPACTSFRQERRRSARPSMPARTVMGIRTTDSWVSRPESGTRTTRCRFCLSEPLPDNDRQGDYWPDGRPNRFNRPQALTLSGCFRKGGVTCTDCHRMHGSDNDHALKVPASRTDLLCTQCHQKVNVPGRASVATTGPAVSAHTHHAAESPGSRCIECHMSDVNWRLLNRRRDHTFAPPVPEMTAAYGAPNPCTTCHDNRSPEWAASVMDRWYGDGARRRAVVATANIMYAAGRGDVGVVQDLAAIASNHERRRGAAGERGRVHRATRGTAERPAAKRWPGSLESSRVPRPTRSRWSGRPLRKRSVR